MKKTKTVKAVPGTRGRPIRRTTIEKLRELLGALDEDVFTDAHEYSVRVERIKALNIEIKKRLLEEGHLTMIGYPAREVLEVTP